MGALVGENDTRLWRILGHRGGAAPSEDDLSAVKQLGSDGAASKGGYRSISQFVYLKETRVRFATEDEDATTVATFR